MSDAITAKYDAFYRAQDPDQVYPVEFVVRAFLGNYPRLSNAAGAFLGAEILDVGFGDGRNVPLLTHLGMQVTGVEISEEICARAVERMRRLGVVFEARVGRNCRLPFPDGRFDHVLACHSCYYLDPGTTFADNVREVARVLKPGGRWVLSVPISSSYILRGARDLGGGRFEIAQDPYGVRNGQIMQAYDGPEGIHTALAGAFTDVRVGACRNDFWGIDEHVWTVVCSRGPKEG